VINGPVFKYVKDACRIEINKFTTDQIVSNREAVEQAIEKRLSKLLDKEGFVLDQFTSGLQYPKTIVEAVDAKNRAIQLAQKAANEVQVAEAEAKKKIVVAEAIVNASLTPLLVKKQWIEKWSGESPKVVGAGSSVLIGLNDLK
jgi:regulator of protease activity HflC (stomatin/prohibitin superfamily)